MGVNDSESLPSPRVLSKSFSCGNGLLSVFKCEVLSYDSSVISDYMIVSSKLPRESIITGVIVAAVVDKKIPLINVFRYPLNEWVWELPRGFIDAGELSVDAAVRELEEETGIVSRKENFVDLGVVAPEGGVLAAKNHIFATKKCIQNEKPSQPDDGHGEIKYFEVDELFEMIHDQRIVDSNTLVALYRVFSCFNLGVN